MPTSTRATSATERESGYQESPKSNEESTQIRKKYSKIGTATKLVISFQLSPLPFPKQQQFVYSYPKMESMLRLLPNPVFRDQEPKNKNEENTTLRKLF